ncbi:VOC family protein [Mycolicibacterium wolinskyi]|uniref:VOC domain-containing protein n=1 Tax=Mycolicibacterium wolinskyi TaxID=59750 RepID=A0A1X2F295_9MYCO|nr:MULTISPECIES: VOC family protein [Mycolicibacterium]MCV7287730.1 VOC family protein [Mycolicibacterium wolinskyi]MCV7294628.1 VOC family protein [Mycolicibacterium goodii]ORX12498.1 hypothetical protein AWC31_31490 [Mycolicibacterium wolinskyi]
MSAQGPRLAHVVLQTGQPEALAQFYAEILNGHVVFAGSGLIFLTCDEEHHRIAIARLPGGAEPKNPKAAGMNHMAFTFDTLDELLDQYQRLAKVGIRPATPDEATAFLQGPDFEADSWGPQFDVEKMVEARANGASVAELTSRTWALSGPKLPHPSLVLASLEPATH